MVPQENAMLCNSGSCRDPNLAPSDLGRDVPEARWGRPSPAVPQGQSLGQAAGTLCSQPFLSGLALMFSECKRALYSQLGPQWDVEGQRLSNLPGSLASWNSGWIAHGKRNYDSLFLFETLLCS